MNRVRAAVWGSTLALNCLLSAAGTFLRGFRYIFSEMDAQGVPDSVCNDSCREYWVQYGHQAYPWVALTGVFLVGAVLSIIWAARGSLRLRLR